MNRMRYQGFNIPRDRFADNTEFYTYCLSNPSYARAIGVTQEMAMWYVNFQRNTPNEEHHRVAAHKVNVYEMRNPRWEARGTKTTEQILSAGVCTATREKGGLLTPRGDLDYVLSMDFYGEIRRICEEEQDLQKEMEPMSIDLGDGTLIRGTRVRVSNYEGPANCKKIPNEHLVITFDPSNFKESGEFFYSFDIKRGSITAEKPKEYHIESYVLIDGERVQEKTEVARAFFEATPHGSPAKFSHLVFTKK